jgi:hypothetical protein
MSAFVLVLQFLGVSFLLVSVLHLLLGPNADVRFLGAQLPAEAITDPALDSQSRFYGVSFSLYGILTIVCATDPVKYAPLLHCILWVFFAGGIARLISIAIRGVPPLPVLILILAELLPPPVMVLWLKRIA